MERLSNSYEDLVSQVGKEFQAIKPGDGQSLLVSYSEIPWFPGGQFCISVISTAKDNQTKLIKQVWDNEYDLNRFSSGVYNLDRLCIKRSDIDISAAQQNSLASIIHSITEAPDTLNDETCIVLDGIDHHLTLNINNIDKKYRWHAATNDIKKFEPLISFLLTATSGK
ncbi:MAG: hypothetical protein QM791_11285 [Ferruginibacter sp.]